MERDIEKTATRAREHGWRLEPGRHAWDTYVWAVRAQVLGDPITRIAEDSSILPKTVRGSVDDLLRFLGLTARPRPGGRPHGSRDRHGVRTRHP